MKTTYNVIMTHAKGSLRIEQTVTGNTYSHLAAILWHSLQEAGGVTYQLETGELNPDKGFMVAVADREMCVAMPQTFSAFGDWLEMYCVGLFHELCKDNLYLGLWYNQEDGKLYFDMSERVETWEEAEYLGHQRKQIAIFDNQTKEVEYL